MVFAMVKRYSNRFYLANAFILLSDVYKEQGKTMQAKVTLENIIETCNNEELINKARLKWEAIVESQANSNQKIVNIEESYLEFDEEIIEYELIMNKK